MKARWTDEMYAAVLAAEADGESFQKIGARYGVSRERARQVIAKAHRLARFRALLAAQEKTA